MTFTKEGRCDTEIKGVRLRQAVPFGGFPSRHLRSCTILIRPWLDQSIQPSHGTYFNSLQRLGDVATVTGKMTSRIGRERWPKTHSLWWTERQAGQREERGDEMWHAGALRRGILLPTHASLASDITRETGSGTPPGSGSSGREARLKTGGLFDLYSKSLGPVYISTRWDVPGCFVPVTALGLVPNSRVISLAPASLAPTLPAPPNTDRTPMGGLPDPSEPGCLLPQARTPSLTDWTPCVVVPQKATLLPAQLLEWKRTLLFRPQTTENLDPFSSTHLGDWWHPFVEWNKLYFYHMLRDGQYFDLLM